MRDISREISHYTRKFQVDCPTFDETKLCSRQGGCACAKAGEIYGFIHSIIKPEYREANIGWFNGLVPNGEGKKKTSEDDATRVGVCKKVQQILSDYMYGDYKKILKNPQLRSGKDSHDRPVYSRIVLDAESCMDQRFEKGESVIIYGEPYRYTKSDSASFVPLKVQQGKTLLASILMIEAIRRKAFKSNKASTFEWISFLQLRQKLKDNSDENDIDDFRTADWLVIDDLDLIIRNNISKADLWTRETFDAFLIDRMENRRPTILVCEFDISKESLKEKMGSAFEKIVTSSSTCLVKV